MYATESDAHYEWHHNSGIPVGQPGCPQDACHLPDPGCWDCFDETPESCPSCIAALAAAEAWLAERASQPDPWAGTPFAAQVVPF
jgi:hypothetical protein